MTLSQALDWRYAVQVFDSKQKLSQTKLELLLSAARKAPSSFNIQPWKVLVIANPSLRAELRKAGYDQSKITEASHLLVFASRTDITSNDVDNVVRITKTIRGLTDDKAAGYRRMLQGFMSGKSQERLCSWAKQQTYLSLGFLLLSAAILGVDAAPMEGFDTAKVDALLELNTTGFTAVVLVALGYRSDKDPAAASKKVRLPVEAVIEVR